MNPAILIVEDEQRLREMMVYALEDEGYQVVQAPDGETAMAVLSQADSTCSSFAVVITDLIMRDVDGVAVMQAARTLPNAPEVILLTGHGSLETAIAAVDQQAFAYLLKPCPPNLLRERVAAAIEHRTTRLGQQEKATAWNKVAQVFGQLQNVTDIESLATPSPGIDDAHVARDEPADPADSLATLAEERYLRVGLLRVDTYHHEISYYGKRIHVTPIEYSILHRLAATPEQVVSFSDLAYATHGQQLDRDEARDLLVWHIRNIRHKIDQRCIVSVRGIGYLLTDPEQKTQR